MSMRGAVSKVVTSLRVTRRWDSRSSSGSYQGDRRPARAAGLRPLLHFRQRHPSIRPPPGAVTRSFIRCDIDNAWHTPVQQFVRRLRYDHANGGASSPTRCPHRVHHVGACFVDSPMCATTPMAGLPRPHNTVRIAATWGARSNRSERVPERRSSCAHSMRPVNAYGFLEVSTTSRKSVDLQASIWHGIATWEWLGVTSVSRSGPRILAKISYSNLTASDPARSISPTRRAP